jgi:hypothetical protein
MESHMPKHFLVVLTLVFTLAAPAFAVDCPSVTWSQLQGLTGYTDWVENLQPIDYDHDGKLDLVGSIRSNNTGISTLHSWHGVGNGTFEVPVSLGTTDVLDIEVANVNNDAYADLIGASYNLKFWVRFGNATGFDPPIYRNVDYTVYDISVIDLGNDSYPDLLVSSFVSGIFVLYQGTGDGSFIEVQRQTVGNTEYVTGNVAADFDADGRLDVAVSRRGSETVAVYFRNLDGTFTAPVLRPTGSFPNDVQKADFNEDGLPDLASTNWDNGTIDVFLNLGSRNFASRLTLSGSKPGSRGGMDPFKLVDVNGDGHVDILGGGINGSWMVTYLGRGNGTFASGSWFFPGDGIASIATGDFNGDTDLDVALGTFGELYIAEFTCATQVNGYSVSPVVSTSQNAPLRARVSGIAADTPLPLGTVTFKEGVTDLGTVNVDATGLAQLDLAGLSNGDHTITAVFSGNSTLGAATSASFVQKVTSATTTTTFAFPPAGSVYGTPFTFNVRINDGQILGYYFLSVDGVETERYSGGSVTLNLTPGQHTLSARFMGDTQNPPSESGPVVINTAKATAGIAKSGELTVRLGTSHNLQFTISGPNGTVTPTGSVQLLRGATVLGNGTLAGGVANVSATLERGSHDVTATYSGDGNFTTGSTSFTLTVVQNVPLAIEARGLQNGIAIRAVVPANTTTMTLYRSISGSGVWTAVGGWSTSSELDPTSLTRGVLYDYRLDATVSGSPQSSNIDSALLFNDDPLAVAATSVKLTHFTELRDAINALRSNAGLPAFNFDGSFGTHAVIRAAHLTAMRNAVAEARTALGMIAVTFTDGTPNGLAIRKMHIAELRDAAR